jgi:hypothetical protein
MSIAVSANPAAGPLSAGHLQELAQAQSRAKKIRTAAGVAAFNGWMTAFFAVASAPFAPFSFAGALVTLGLGVVAYNEFQGRRKLLQFDARGADLLGWNQLGFLGLIVVYSAWMLFTGLTGEGPFAGELQRNPELAGVLGSLQQYDDLYRLIVVAVYGSVIVLSSIFQGGNAWYYFSRRKLLAGYLRDTPVWICDLQRATAAH